MDPGGLAAGTAPAGPTLANTNPPGTRAARKLAGPRCRAIGDSGSSLAVAAGGGRFVRLGHTQQPPPARAHPGRTHLDADLPDLPGLILDAALPRAVRLHVLSTVLHPPRRRAGPVGCGSALAKGDGRRNWPACPGNLCPGDVPNPLRLGLRRRRLSRCRPLPRRPVAPRRRGLDQRRLRLSDGPVLLPARAGLARATERVCRWVRRFPWPSRSPNRVRRRRSRAGVGRSGLRLLRHDRAEDGSGLAAAVP